MLQAAKVRYELRNAELGSGGRELRLRSDSLVAQLLQLASGVATTGQEPDPDELAAASVPLVALQAGELGLADRASRLRDMQRTVLIASRNMTTHAGGDQTSGFFADDKETAEWLDRQLDNDATYLEVASQRARSVTALADQLIQRGLQRRGERFNLGLTGVVGAVLMVLAAVQSFQYAVPIAKPVQPTVISALGAFALLVSLVVLRAVAPGRRWPDIAVWTAAGLLGAATAWVIVATVAWLDGGPSGGVAAVWVTWASAGAGAALGFAVAVVITVRSGSAIPK